MHLTVLLYGLMFIAYLLLPAVMQILTTTIGEHATTAEQIGPFYWCFSL